jgi:hypothetical protein
LNLFPTQSCSEALTTPLQAVLTPNVSNNASPVAVKAKLLDPGDNGLHEPLSSHNNRLPQIAYRLAETCECGCKLVGIDGCAVVKPY